MVIVDEEDNSKDPWPFPSLFTRRLNYEHIYVAYMVGTALKQE